MEFVDRELFYRLCGIYCITCKETNKKYIGATTDKFCTRYILHESMLRRGKHNKIIQRDFDFYGEDSFCFEVLEVIDKNEREKIANREEYYIQKYDSQNNGYNRTSGGDGALRFDEETRKSIAEKNRVYMTGKKMPEEHKKKLTELNKNRHRTQKEKDHLSDFFYGEKSNLAVLTEGQVKQIETMLINGASRKEVSDTFGVTEGCIQDIQYSHRWKKTEVDGWREYQSTLPHPHVITEEQEKEIAEKLANGETKWYIHNQYHVSYDKMRNIAKKYGI